MERANTCCGYDCPRDLRRTRVAATTIREYRHWCKFRERWFRLAT